MLSDMCNVQVETLMSKMCNLNTAGKMLAIKSVWKVNPPRVEFKSLDAVNTMVNIMNISSHSTTTIS